MRQIVSFDYEDARRTMYSWACDKVINMTPEQVNEQFYKNPKQLYAIYWKYVHKMLKKKRDKRNSNDGDDKKANIRSFVKQGSLHVIAPECQYIGCHHPILAYNYCIQHFQRFVSKQYPTATAKQINQFLNKQVPRQFVKQAIIVEPVKPVTPAGSQTPQTNTNQNEPHPNQPQTQNQNQNQQTNNKNKKPTNNKPTLDPQQVKTEQQQQVQEMTDSVVDKLESAFANNDIRSISAYGMPVKPNNKIKKTKKIPISNNQDIPDLNTGYQQMAHTNFTGGGDLNYFTPYTAILQAERLLIAQSKIWKKAGMSEKEIATRLKPYKERINKFKTKTQKTKPIAIEQSPDKNSRLLTVK